MADLSPPWHTTGPGEWAALEARARAECDGLQEEMAALAAELSRTGDPEGLNKALRDQPDRSFEWAWLEVEARSVYDHMVLDLRRLDDDIENLEAELFLHYEREMSPVGGGNAAEPTVDAIKAAVTVDARHQALVQRREVLVHQAQEAKSVLRQLTVTRTAAEQHGASLLRLSANRRAELHDRAAVSQNPPPAVPDSAPPVADIEDKGAQPDSAGATPPSVRGAPDESRERRYFGADSRPKFRQYVRLLRGFVSLEEDAYELARLGGGGEIAQFRQELATDIANLFEQLSPRTLFGDLLLVSTLPVSYVDAEARANQFVGRVLGRVEKGALAEHVAQFKRALARLCVPRLEHWPADDARYAAAERIVDGIGHAIHPIRWPWVKSALGDLAKLHKSTTDVELRCALIAALFEAVEVAGEYTLGQEDDMRRALRAKLNDLATVDLLGPGWRHATEGVDILLEEDQEDEGSWRHAEQAEARLRLGRLVAAARLSSREAEVFEIVKILGLEHGALDTAAKKLGIEPPTARGLWYKARQKLLAAARR